MKNIRTLRRMVTEMAKGEKIYMNAINMSINMIEQTRAYIQDGVIAPVEEDLKAMIVEEALNKYRSGECICPQMTYVKL